MFWFNTLQYLTLSYKIDAIKQNKYLEITNASGMCFGVKHHPTAEPICKRERVREIDRVKILLC